MSQFVSFSQHADDYIAWQLLGKKKEGLVIEVGAFDGIHLSNSYSLEQLGWKSICIEPNPNIYKFLVKNRPESIHIHAAVVDDPIIGQIDFFAEEIGVLSGCTYDEEDIKRRYQNRGLEYKVPEKITVPAFTLNQIFKNNNLQKYEIDLLSIDVEGLEVEVLKGLDLNYYEPGLIIIEANTDHHKEGILSYFKKFTQYQFLGNNRQNLFILREDLWNKKLLKEPDFSNYKAAKQYHPVDQKLAIQSVPPLFEGSEKYKILIKPSFLEKIIKRIR